MMGIPIPILRGGQQETAYLSTRRTGEAGRKMKALKRAYYDAQRTYFDALRDVEVLVKRAEAAAGSPDALAQLEALSAEQGKRLAVVSAASFNSLDAAEALVSLALRENHGPDADAILDTLTDKQIRRCVSILELGEVPEDFFPSPGTPRSGSGISPAGATTPGSSPRPATPPATSPVDV